MLLGFTRAGSRSRKSMIKGHSTGKQLVKMLILLGLVLLIHVIAMMYFENMSLGNAIWLTMTSATTVGYGDLSAKTLEGRTATILLLYVGGIAVLAQVAAMYFEYHSEVRDNMLKGNWSWIMKNHIAFLNCPAEIGEEYFYNAISSMRKSKSELADLPIIIVSEKFSDGISERLRKLGVVHVSKPMSHDETLESASVVNANTIIILSKDRKNPVSDSVNFELVDRLREIGVKGRIIVEVVRDENRERMQRIGANSVLRPIRAYPELLARTIIAPGYEQVIETLFNSTGEECIRYEVNVELDWLTIIQRLASNDYGIPIAYEDDNGVIRNNPSSKKIVKTNAIFTIVHEGGVKNVSEVQKILSQK